MSPNVPLPIFLGSLLWVLVISVPGESLASPDLSIADLFNYGNNYYSPRASRSSQRQQQQQQQNGDESDHRCGYKWCPATDDEKLNVHVIAHTHDDVGWLKTVDQYYYGLNKPRNKVGVRHILNSVIPQLVMDPRKRFIYVEMSFFYKWWQEQEEPMRDIVIRLVNEGRLEFINGGWCMNDEANVNYQSTIEQMTLGLKFLNETFGVCGHPKVGWQIDPFGHTSEQASLFSQFGFDSMFVARINYKDKLSRRQNRSLDIVWHADRALAGHSGSIYTNVMWDGYDSPPTYCFDVQCLDDEIVDNKNSYEYNIEFKAKNLIELFRNRQKSQLTNDLLMPFGGDFQFSAAEQNFLNIDKLIKYINKAAPDINMFYSTPSCYTYSLYNHLKRKHLELPEKFDDFMPYDSDATVWWSGYFTSRPSVKLIERQVADLLQLTRIVSVSSLIRLSKKPNFSWSTEVKNHEDQCLMPLWEILGDLQHHDAVTGTEKQHVADDYVRRAQDATNLCLKFISLTRREQMEAKMRQSSLYKKLAAIKSKYSNLEPIFLDKTDFCFSLNISQCEPLESNVDYNSTFYSLARPTMANNDHHHQSPLMSASLDEASMVASNKSKKEFPVEFETRSVLMHAYNPYSHEIKHHDFRLPCMGICDLNKVKVLRLSNNATLELIRLPVSTGVLALPFRDAITTYEMLFYSDLPPLGHTSFIIEDLNTDEIIDDELADDATSSRRMDSPETRKETKHTATISSNNAMRSKRIKRNDDLKFDYLEIRGGSSKRTRRELNSTSESDESDKIVVKFDLQAGMIVGLKRTSDGSALNISQKFGYYYPASTEHRAGAYIFRPNTSEPHLLDKPIFYKMYKRKNGALVEIHQKWSDWIWQTIRVDSKKNYIEFDYIVGPIPALSLTDANRIGREIITRYSTDLKTDQVFLTDSNSRQLLIRKSNRSKVPQDLGQNFYPIVSTIMLKNTKDQDACTKCKAEAVSILVDRPQAGSSLNEGQLELLIHRRLFSDDNFGVGEALNEPGEDSLGLVTRGKHRLFLRFPKNNVAASNKPTKRPVLFKLPNKESADKSNSSYIVHDQLHNDLSQESRRYALRPILTFDRLRITSSQFIEMLAATQSGDLDGLAEESLLNSSIPSNIHLLTIQPWSGGAQNRLLIRLENLDNPLTIQPQPDYRAYAAILQSYDKSSERRDASELDSCDSDLRPRTSVDLENLLRGVRILSFEEMSLGANIKLQDVERLNFFGSPDDKCDKDDTTTLVSLAPRQIKTLLATYETI